MRTLFTRKEAAARLNISLVTLDEEQQGGYLAYIQRKPGGRVWIAEDAIEEYLKRATHPVKSERQFSGYTHRKLRIRSNSIAKQDVHLLRKICIITLKSPEISDFSDNFGGGCGIRTHVTLPSN